MKTLLLSQHPWICSITRKSPTDEVHFRRLHSTMIYEFRDLLGTPEAMITSFHLGEASLYNSVQLRNQIFSR
jgi:hypothetical protein